ncbi:hypothetical protein K7640_15755 [Micromonospora sp. PLK6-60]|uniref:hypothetical protein n=1 Tax=Micromonospora sp. PLK6-60 TaxID=2873383 RepID=UPI001CA662E5|nr:hypothetical protein [Micromonospora sp. PLK6-60]MBY8873289.1 hypothetical protein [Micromonospora sp. PLK6-60]
MPHTAVAKLFTLKAGVAALAVAATGGVALAAANGALPNPLDRPAERPAAQATGPLADRDRDEASTASRGNPSRHVVGLCRAYSAGDNPGEVLAKPAFAALTDAAGDRGRVAAYCDDLLATRRNGKGNAPSTRPTPDAHPTGGASARPTAPPSKPGDDHPPTASPHH